jgi:hypothetical protein
MTRAGKSSAVARQASVVALQVLMVAATHAATFIVDDSGTLPYQSVINSRWQQTGSGGRRQIGNQIEGSTTLTIHLNLTPWLNRNAHIYLALPQQSIGVVNVEWATQGRLQPGKLQSGDRTLVYAGLIRSGVLEDTIAVKVVLDGRRMTLAQRLEFHFEIDVD